MMCGITRHNNMPKIVSSGVQTSGCSSGKCQQQAGTTAASPVDHEANQTNDNLNRNGTTRYFTRFFISYLLLIL